MILCVNLHKKETDNLPFSSRVSSIISVGFAVVSVVFRGMCAGSERGFRFRAMKNMRSMPQTGRKPSVEKTREANILCA